MTKVGSARRRALDIYSREPGRYRKIVLIQMLVSTLFAAGNLSTLSLPQGASTLVLCASIYLSNVATFSMIAALAGAATDIKVNPLRIPSVWIFSLVSPAITMVVSILIGSFLGANFTDSLNLISSILLGDVLLIALAVMMVLLAVLLYMAAYTVGSQAVIRSVTAGRLGASGVGRSVRGGISNIISPAANAVRNIHILILAGLLVLVSFGVYFASGPVDMSMRTDLIPFQIMNLIQKSRPTNWAMGGLLVLSYTWIYGLGVWFWPRYRLTHVVQQIECIRQFDSYYEE